MNMKNIEFNYAQASFISFFLYFLIVRKSTRTLMRRKMTVSMVTRKFHLVAAKKGSFDFVIMDIYYRYDEDLPPHPPITR